MSPTLHFHLTVEGTPCRTRPAAGLWTAATSIMHINYLRKTENRPWPSDAVWLTPVERDDVNTR